MIASVAISPRHHRTPESPFRGRRARPCCRSESAHRPRPQGPAPPRRPQPEPHEPYPSADERAAPWLQRAPGQRRRPTTAHSGRTCSSGRAWPGTIRLALKTTNGRNSKRRRPGEAQQRAQPIDGKVSCPLFIRLEPAGIRLAPPRPVGTGSLEKALRLQIAPRRRRLMIRR